MSLVLVRIPYSSDRDSTRRDGSSQARDDQQQERRPGSIISRKNKPGPGARVGLSSVVAMALLVAPLLCVCAHASGSDTHVRRDKTHARSRSCLEQGMPFLPFSLFHCTNF